MPNLKVGIVISAIDRATKPLRALSGAAGATGKALAKMGGQSAASRKLDRLASAANGSRRATGGLGRELRELSAETRDAAAGTARLAGWQERLGRAAGQARAQVGRLGRALDTRLSRKRPAPRAGGRGGFLSGVAGGIAGSAVFAGGRAAMRLPAGFIETASMFETMETTLGTIEGSSRKAKKSMEWIGNFAATTPFELDQVSEAFVKLRAYGMEPTGGLLRSLGDTASAMGKDVMQAVEAIADAVTGENERLKEFGIKARTKGDTVTYEYGGGKVATANARDRAEIQRVLTGIMDEQYSGAMNDRMKTFTGMMSNLSDQWTRFQLKVMESGPFEILKGRLRGALESINAMAASGELQAYADRVGQWFVDAFEKFERDVLPALRDEVWPALRDDIWPALKDIAGVIGDILKRVNDVVNAFGGWGVAVRFVALLLGGKLALGALRMLGGGFRTAQDAYGGIKNAVTSERATRMRKGGARLLRSGFDIGKAGAGKAAGGLARFGRTLASLALRFAPLLMGALKALAAVFAGISLPVAAAVAAIAGAAYLIWKHWEPIKGFFSRLWEGVRTAFSGFWEWLSAIDWSGLGARLMGTLAAGIRSAAGAVWDALRGGLGKLAELLPSSDARAGPLSRLSSSGAAILATLGDGVRRAGPGALRRPLAGALGTAAAGLALSVPPGPALSIPPALIEAPGRSPASLARIAPRPASQERPQAAVRPALQPEGPAAPPPPRERLRAAPPPALQPGSPAAPSTQQAVPQVSRTVHHHYRITIQQLPGEDAEELAGRVIRELERRQALAGREALGDAY